MKLGRRCAGLAAVAGSVALATAVEAATLADVQGEVLVNRGGGYQKALDATELNPGDSVIAGMGGGAKITFADGCVLSVEPGVVLTITEKSPCKSAGAPIKTGSTDSGGGGGSGGGAPIETGATGTSGPDTSTLIVGGLVVGGAIAAAVALSGDGDNGGGGGGGGGGDGDGDGDGGGGGGGLPPASP